MVGGPTRLSGGLDAREKVWLVLLTGRWVVLDSKVKSARGLTERQREYSGGIEECTGGAKLSVGGIDRGVGRARSRGRGVASN